MCCFPDFSDTLFHGVFCCDLTEKAMEIYDLIRRYPHNMYLLKGNHELMMRDFLIKYD